MRSSYITLALILFTVSAPKGIAEVTGVSQSGFQVACVATVGGGADSAFKILVRDIGLWWDPAHTWSGDSRNLNMDARAGGCFCESLPEGGSVKHMEVVYIDPGKLLRMRGALGPLQSSGLTGSLSWSLTGAGDSTIIEMTYSVGGYWAGSLEELAPIVDGVLHVQLIRLKSYLETGSPKSP